MLLSVVRARARAGAEPDRPMVLCFTADEEAGGHQGAEQIVLQRPDLLEGCTEGIGEVGGFSTTVRGRRLYLIEAAEKGMAWMRLTATGNAGHGSMRHPDNAVTTLAQARRADRHAPVAGPADPVDAGAAVRGRRARRRGGHAAERRGAGRGVRLGRPHARCGDPQHHEPDHARRRLQGERRPGRGDRARGRSIPAGLRGRVLRDAGPPRRRRRPDRLRQQAGRPRDHVRRRPRRGDDHLDPRRGPGRDGGAVPHVRRHRRQALAQARDPLLRLRARSGCPPTWTSPRCSTGSTSGCPRTRWSSARGSSTGSSTGPEPISIGVRRRSGAAAG